MLHEMKLHPAPFASIKSGEKTVEMRLYDEKRAKIRVGDEIKFTCTVTAETLRCKVSGFCRYADFADLYRHHDKISIGYAENETADPEDMAAYYSREDIAKYGVVAIVIEVIK